MSPEFAARRSKAIKATKCEVCGDPIMGGANMDIPVGYSPETIAYFQERGQKLMCLKCMAKKAHEEGHGDAFDSLMGLGEGTRIRAFSSNDVKQGHHKKDNWVGEGHLTAEWVDGGLTIEVAERGGKEASIHITKPDDIKKLQSILFQIEGEEA